MTRRARPRRRVALALVLAGLLLLALELVVRTAGLVDIGTGAATPHQAAFNAADLFVSADESLGYRNKPEAVALVDGITYRHDARGRRVLSVESQPRALGDPRQHGSLADEPRPRVAFLGDSTTYGLGLAAADTLPAQVAAALGDAIDPLNLGVCGYGTSQEAALYAAERDALAGCELVVLVFFPNDFSPGTFRWDSGLRLMYLDPLPLPHALKGPLWRSALYRWIVSGVTRRRQQRGEFDALNPANRQQALDAVRALAERCQADGRTLLVAHLPAMEALDPYLFEAPVAALAQACELAGIPYVDLLPAFLDERERQSAAWAERTGAPPDATLRAGFLSQYWIDHPRDHHLDAQATRIAALALARAIAERLALPAPSPPR